MCIDTSNTMTPVPCNKCGRELKNKNSLGFHLRTYHGIYKSKPLKNEKKQSHRLESIDSMMHKNVQIHTLKHSKDEDDGRCTMIPSPNASIDENMDNFLLVPASGDMTSAKEIQLPKGLCVAGTGDDVTMTDLVPDSCNVPRETDDENDVRKKKSRLSNVNDDASEDEGNAVDMKSEGSIDDRIYSDSESSSGESDGSQSSDLFEPSKIRKKRRFLQVQQKFKRRGVKTSLHKCRKCIKYFDTAKELRRHFMLKHNKSMKAIRSKRSRFSSRALSDSEGHDNVHSSMKRKRSRSDDEYEANPKRSYSDDSSGCESNNLTPNKRKKLMQTVKHIECVGVDKYIEVFNLMQSEEYDEILKKEEYLRILQLLFNGLKTGWIPICGFQFANMSDKIKNFINRFNDNLTMIDVAELLSSNRKIARETFRSVNNSIKLVLDSWMTLVDKCITEISNRQNNG